MATRKINTGDRVLVQLLPGHLWYEGEIGFKKPIVVIIESVYDDGSISGYVENSPEYFICLFKCEPEGSRHSQFKILKKLPKQKVSSEKQNGNRT